MMRTPAREACMAATNRILEEVVTARNQLELPVWTDGSGILSSPSDLKSSLREARRAIENALLVLDTTAWPTSEDCDAGAALKQHES